MPRESRRQSAQHRLPTVHQVRHPNVSARENEDVIDRLIRGGEPSATGRALAVADGSTRARLLGQLQQARGNTFVQRVVAEWGRRPSEPGEADLEERIRARQGAGSTFADEVRRPLEVRFGADLSQVRIHTDGEADELARAVDAVAFTTGQDVFFRAGAYDPSSPAGFRLMAHEVAHTVQQAAGPVGGAETEAGILLSEPHDAFEHEASRAADAVVGGERAATSPQASPSVTVARAEWWESLMEGEVPKTLIPDIAADDVIGGAIDFADALGKGGDWAGPVGGALGPLSMLWGGKDIYENVTEEGTFGLDNLVDTVRGAGNIFSGGTSFATLIGALPSVAGSTSLGAIGGMGAGAGLAAAGQVASAGLAGYGVGRLLDEGVGEIGQAIFGGEEDKYNISSGMAALMQMGDEAVTGGMRGLGLYDESKPAYTQTIGWQLAEVLPSWLQ